MPHKISFRLGCPTIIGEHRAASASVTNDFPWLSKFLWLRLRGSPFVLGEPSPYICQPFQLGRRSLSGNLRYEQKSTNSKNYNDFAERMFLALVAVSPLAQQDAMIIFSICSYIKNRGRRLTCTWMEHRHRGAIADHYCGRTV